MSRNVMRRWQSTLSRTYASAATAMGESGWEYEEEDIEIGDEPQAPSGGQVMQESAERVDGGIRFTYHLAADKVARSKRKVSKKLLPQHQKQIKDLEALLSSENPGHDAVWRAYERLPAPRVKYLTDTAVADLLHILRRPRRKDSKYVEQYFAVMDDMSASKVTPSVRDYTSAIYMVGRHYGQHRNSALEKALEMFQEMVRKGQRRPNTVTYNTLCHLCLRAGRLDVMDAVLTEMATNGIQPTRQTYVLRLTYYGQKRDVPGLRRVYKEMIDSGELVDTVVLNCIIKGLLVSGEHGEADRVLSSMKIIHKTRTGSEKAAEVSWKASLHVSHVLSNSAWQVRKKRHLYSAFQDASPVLPNSYTYFLLIRHHSWIVGDVQRVLSLLSEMQKRSLLIPTVVFTDIFASFTKHSPWSTSPWTMTNLLEIYQLYVKTLDHSEQRHAETDLNALNNHYEKFRLSCVVHARLVRHLLVAVTQRGGHVHARAIWEELRHRWTPKPEEEWALVDIVEGRLIGRRAGEWNGREIQETHDELAALPPGLEETLEVQSEDSAKVQDRRNRQRGVSTATRRPPTRNEVGSEVLDELDTITSLPEVQAVPPKVPKHRKTPERRERK